MAPPVVKREFCKRCKIYFKDWDTYHAHLIQSDRHHACYVCAAEFHNQDALNVHCKQDHAHPQDLRCVQCFRRFTTLGGLTAHIEFDEAGCYSGTNLTAKVHETTARDRKIDAARNFKGGRAGGKEIPEDEPRPVMKDWSTVAAPTRTLGYAPGNAAYIGTQPSSSNVNRGPPVVQNAAVVGASRVAASSIPLRAQKSEDLFDFTAIQSSVSGSQFTSLPAVQEKLLVDVTTKEVGDLISFDAPARIMNAPWDDCVPPSIGDAYPALTTYKNPMSTPNIIDTPATGPTVWGNFAAAPPVVPTVTQDANQLNPWHIDQPNEPVMSPWDPDNPAFRHEMYLNEITQKYRCPHPGCKKHTIPNRNAFIHHLQSAAHRNERLQCHGCLRLFDTATALTQHASAQGVRCRVRESDNYDNEVTRITAGHATPAGRFDDDTIRYANTDVPQNPQDIVASHKAAIAKRAEETEHYWENHKPRW